jgi:hypothetical protein
VAGADAVEMVEKKAKDLLARPTSIMSCPATLRTMTYEHQARRRASICANASAAETG